MQIPWLKSCLSTSTADWNLVQAHFALFGSDQQYGDPSPMSHKYYPGMCGGWASVSPRAGLVKGGRGQTCGWALTMLSLHGLTLRVTCRTSSAVWEMLCSL